nr:MAG TPA: hypothetical protein [Caudoviricetes sp.]
MPESYRSFSFCSQLSVEFSKSFSDEPSDEVTCLVVLIIYDYINQNRETINPFCKVCIRFFCDASVPFIEDDCRSFSLFYLQKSDPLC